MLKRIREKYREGLEKTKNIPLDTLKNLKIAYIPYNELLKEGFFAGIGWAFGVTIGFVIISSIIVVVLRSLGGLPLIGNWVADIVEETQAQLSRRNPLIPQ